MSSGIVTVEELLAAAREGIWRLAPEETPAAVERGALLIDIRQAHQRDRDGLVPGASVVERNVLEWRLDPRSEAQIPVPLPPATAVAKEAMSCVPGPPDMRS